MSKNEIYQKTTSPLFWGIIVAVAIGLIGTFLLSFIFYFTSLPENYLKPTGIALYLIGAFFGGFTAAKKAGRKALLYGTEVGLFYFLFTVLTIALIAPTSFSFLNFSLKAVYTLLISAAGGVIGVAFTE